MASSPKDSQGLKPRELKEPPVPNPTLQLYFLPLPASPSASTFPGLLFSQNTGCYPVQTHLKTGGQTPLPLAPPPGLPAPRTPHPKSGFSSLEAWSSRASRMFSALWLRNSSDTPSSSFLGIFPRDVGAPKGAATRGEHRIRPLFPSCFLRPHALSLGR